MPGQSGTKQRDAARPPVEEGEAQLALEVVEPAMRRVADQRAIVRDQLSVVGMVHQYFRNGARVAGVDQGTAQGQPERGVWSVP